MRRLDQAEEAWDSPELHGGNREALEAHSQSVEDRMLFAFADMVDAMNRHSGQDVEWCMPIVATHAGQFLRFSDVLHQQKEGTTVRFDIQLNDSPENFRMVAAIHNHPAGSKALPSDKDITMIRNVNRHFAPIARQGGILGVIYLPEPEHMTFAIFDSEGNVLETKRIPRSRP